jgi:hypothetical protein
MLLYGPAPRHICFFFWGEINKMDELDYSQDVTFGMEAAGMEGGGHRKKKAASKKKKPAAKKTTAATWKRTARKVTIKKARGPDVTKTVYRNSATGELRVRKLVSRSDGSKRVSYVSF